MPKSKKGKKKNASKENEIKTTYSILHERKKCMCPRLGDYYYHIIKEQNIKQNNAITQIINNNNNNANNNTIKKIIKANITTTKDNTASTTTIINLSGYELSSIVPIKINNSIIVCPTTILELNLSKNNLFNTNELFTNMQSLINLEVLNISKNKLIGPLPNNVCSFTKLKVLRIDENHITSLPIIYNDGSDDNDDINGDKQALLWSNLTIFSASYNEIQDIPSSTSGWTNLVEFNIRNNQLEKLPETISKWKNIQYLLLSNNKLNSIPESIKDLISLKVLEVKSNSLEGTLPLGLVNCTNIEYLNVADNKLTAVGSDELFSSMSKLIELELYKNKITFLPPSIGNLKLLKKLSLSNNNLKELPEEIGNLQENLKEIYVNNNASFARLPASIGNLTSLTELQLRGCPKLKTLPNTLAQCTNLKELDMRKKGSCKLPAKLYQSLEEEIGCTMRGCVSKNAKKSKK